MGIAKRDARFWRRRKPLPIRERGRWRDRGDRQRLGGMMIFGQPGGGYRGSQCLLGSEVAPRIAKPNFGRWSLIGFRT